MSKYKLLFRGTAFSSKSSKEIEILKDHLFCIHDDGKIEKIVAPEDPNYQVLLDAYQGKDNFYSLAEGQYILPGFIDLHVHAPQWTQSGTALDIPLYDWLNTYTFPLESKFSDLDFAYEVYNDLVRTLLANGTTTALYFATIHKESSLLLARICAERGQRGLVGKVVMDDPEQNPENYRDADTKAALADTEEFILAVKALSKTVKQGVFPVVTPRFIQAARMRRCKAWESWPKNTTRTCNRTAAKATGLMVMFGTGSGKTMPMRCMILGCCATSPSWPTAIS